MGCMRRACGPARAACPGGPLGHAGPVGRFCPWREEEKEREGPTESGLADRGLPWLAEATMCGALNSPAGLTFLSLRGAAPASFPDPVPLIQSSQSQFILSARSIPFPPSLVPFPTHASERVDAIRVQTSTSMIYPNSHPASRFLHPHGRPSRALHKQHLLTVVIQRNPVP
jgi:hypothetical protein